MFWELLFIFLVLAAVAGAFVWKDATREKTARRYESVDDVNDRHW
jgi:hypothetical protein